MTLVSTSASSLSLSLSLLLSSFWLLGKSVSANDSVQSSVEDDSPCSARASSVRTQYSSQQQICHCGWMIFQAWDPGSSWVG
jgi:hypothetical protein